MAQENPYLLHILIRNLNQDNLEGSLEKIRKLLEKSPNCVNRQDETGNTPLHYLAGLQPHKPGPRITVFASPVKTRRGVHPDDLQNLASELITTHGADPNLKNKTGLLPVDLLSSDSVEFNKILSSPPNSPPRSPISASA
ncbi:MAG: hypothetical protein ACD_44C00290G0002 [uncultured bacterium]|nr:MAG: hypothetical protein ACD_44C00290G0002 [uncultured bacterium]OGT15790.1 MAG: hypothetical protein A3B69_00075 [Gammaproteobacteria bacterium RIFCSPHIGHO2_02_FULL_38_33]OGT24871.1 MAG: hypothetical protein A2W47_07435 [Gammaproteobacteria bacterium RIFCSPHIGHO2_12_38_15]OGT69096.1 MAG: hypothetical protein A3I12_05990 [Gammaproteobacteria bacterium RIFCSPLOWO2_02_FULL_38_11]OGT76478.1 MAG: hypothetical protein A3G71_05670 [Gammaproteobacteria bacterium RIFCSPLOWO2_12_FULL_38_14]